MTKTLIARFDEQMLGIYQSALTECNYNATRFLQMLSERGGLATARHLINAPQLSDGFTALWKYGRLDLTVEALVLTEPWIQLFSDAERKTAKRRLDELGYTWKK